MKLPLLKPIPQPVAKWYYRIFAVQAVICLLLGIFEKQPGWQIAWFATVVLQVIGMWLVRNDRVKDPDQ